MCTIHYSIVLLYLAQLRYATWNGFCFYVSLHIDYYLHFIAANVSKYILLHLMWIYWTEFKSRITLIPKCVWQCAIYSLGEKAIYIGCFNYFSSHLPFLSPHPSHLLLKCILNVFTVQNDTVGSLFLLLTSSVVFLIYII